MALVLKWNQRVNLIGARTGADAWARHVEDSLQLVPLAPAGVASWVDLGSGGGFPGIPVAIALAGREESCRVTLIESDARKAEFLRAAAEAFCPAVSVLNARAESAAPQSAAVVSARALAPLPDLLPLVARHLAPSGMALLPKGRRAAQEIVEARKAWSFDLEVMPSVTEAEAAVLRLHTLERRTGAIG